MNGTASEGTLRQHDVTLKGKRVLLRPMTEDDWDILLGWNNDPEVLYFSNGGNATGYPLATVQHIYRSVSRNAFNFIVEFEGAPIGECWLQRMNLERILRLYPGIDCRRIDMMIGEKDYWGRGIGSEALHLLLEFAFRRENADAVFACDVGDYNRASLRMFKKAGFDVCNTVEEQPARKARFSYDLVLMREKYADGNA